MRPGAKKLIFPFILVLVGLWISGCGSNDLLDEERIRYSVYLQPQNNDEDTDDIDVVPNDCDGEAETFQDWGSEVTITSDLKTATLKITSYEVWFVPIRGVYATDYRTGNETFVNFTPPPDLPSPLNGVHRQFTQPKVMANGTLTFEILIWPAELKLYYVYNFLQDQQGLNGVVLTDNPLVTFSEAEASSFEYDYRVILHGENSEGQDITLEAYGTVVFADYNNC